MAEILGINHRRIERGSRVDVDSALAERMLNGSLNSHLAWRVDTEQELNEANFRGEDPLCNRIIDGLEAFKDSRVATAGAYSAGKRGHFLTNCLLHGIGAVGAKKGGSVDVGNTGIDKRKKLSRFLYTGKFNDRRAR